MKGRWIDVNMGDSRKWKHRSRYVAKEFDTGDEDGVFASTLPFETLRLIISDATTLDQEKQSKNGERCGEGGFSRHQQGGQSV